MRPVAAALWLWHRRSMAAPGIWTGSHAATGWRLSTAEPQPTHAPVGVLTHDGATHELRTFPSDASGSIRLAIDDDEFTVELLDVGANALLAVPQLSGAARWRCAIRSTQAVPSSRAPASRLGWTLLPLSRPLQLA